MGRGRRQQARPDDAVQGHEHEQERHGRRNGVQDGEAGDGDAAHEQLTGAPEPSASAPVTGAEKADENVSSPRNNPDAAVLPPRSWMWNGAVGSSCSADRNTVKREAAHHEEARREQAIARRAVHGSATAMP